jgi:putative membrane protein
LALAWEIAAFTSLWLHLKLALVLVLSALHGFMAGTVRAFAEDRNTRPARFYRILNEVPTVALVLIVLLVVFKPF